MIAVMVISSSAFVVVVVLFGLSLCKVAADSDEWMERVVENISRSEEDADD